MTYIKIDKDKWIAKAKLLKPSVDPETAFKSLAERWELVEEPEDTSWTVTYKGGSRDGQQDKVPTITHRFESSILAKEVYESTRYDTATRSILAEYVGLMT